MEARSAALVNEELQRARKLTQVRMAKEMGMSQDSVSRLENRTELLMSTLRETVEAMGGQLRLVAEFPDRAPVVLAGIFEEDRTTGSGRRKGPVPKRVA